MNNSTRWIAPNGTTLVLVRNGRIDALDPVEPGKIVTHSWVRGGDDAVESLINADRGTHQHLWYWPEDPSIVVVPNEGRDKRGARWVYAYQQGEVGHGSWYCSDKSTPDGNGDLHQACHAYFAAHPLPTTAPDSSPTTGSPESRALAKNNARAVRELTESLAQARRDAGLSVHQLASLIGRSPEDLARIEAREEPLTMPTFQNIAQALGLRIGFTTEKAGA